MNFKIYDILSLLIPGFIILFLIMHVYSIPLNNDFVVFYTAIAFVLGFMINAISSWFESFYFLTWGGKPSDKILSGESIWNVKFYSREEVRKLLIKETINDSPSNDELFSIALRHVNLKDSRIEDLNAYYSFSRSLLTTVLICSIILITKNYCDWRYYLILVPVSFIIWMRCKERGYYFVREVLNEYLKQKNIT